MFCSLVFLVLPVLVSLFDDLGVFDLEVVQVVIEAAWSAELVLRHVSLGLMSRRHLSLAKSERVGSLLGARVVLLWQVVLQVLISWWQVSQLHGWRLMVLMLLEQGASIKELVQLLVLLCCSGDMDLLWDGLSIVSSASLLLASADLLYHEAAESLAFLC